MLEKKKIGRPPSKKPRNIPLQVRLNAYESDMLTECAQLMNTTKTDVLIQGVQKIYNEIKKDKKK